MLIAFLFFGSAYAQTKPIIKTEQKIYTKLMSNGEWKRGEIGCDDEFNEYNAKGQLIKQHDIKYNEENGKDSLLLAQLYLYQNDKLIREEHYNSKGHKFREESFQYDRLNREISSAEKYFYASGNEKSGSKVSRTTYSTANTSEEILGNFYPSTKPQEEWIMDPVGRTIRPKSSVNLVVEEAKVIKNYNVLGNVIKATTIDMFIHTVDSIQRTVNYKYNRQNKLIYEEAIGINPYVATYKYNKDGTLKSETFNDFASKEIIDYKYLKYNQYGDWVLQSKTEKTIRYAKLELEPDEIVIKGHKHYPKTWLIKREIKYDE